MPNPAFVLQDAAPLRSAVIFASPHSGRDYSDGFLADSVLDPLTLRSSEDAFVDQLFGAAPQVGAPLLCAQAPRAFVDLNRSPEELDPALIRSVPRGPHNPRVASGLGVIPRVVAGGRSIYHGKMDRDVAMERLETIWQPYHSELKRLLARAHRKFGQAILVDCHSMPSEAVHHVARDGRPAPDVVLGDRFGAAASERIVEQIEAAFRAAGFFVQRNTPFAGAYVTQHYGRPGRRQHAIQIELNRALYMDESAVTPHGSFAEIQQRLAQVTAKIAAIGAAEMPLAAE